MTKKEFEEQCEWLRSAIAKYKDPGIRLAAIIGYLRGIDPDTVLTVGQVSQLLELRHPEKEESTCIGWGATGA